MRQTCFRVHDGVTAVRVQMEVKLDVSLSTHLRGVCQMKENVPSTHQGSQIDVSSIEGGRLGPS